MKKRFYRSILDGDIPEHLSWVAPRTGKITSDIYYGDGTWKRGVTVSIHKDQDIVYVSRFQFRFPQNGGRLYIKLGGRAGEKSTAFILKSEWKRLTKENNEE